MMINSKNRKNLSYPYETTRDLNNTIIAKGLFNEVVQWINEKNEDLQLHIIPDNVVNIEIELSNSKNYTEESEKNFYFRSGELLALLYILNIKNIKAEHILASGEYPIITSKIEFETNVFNQLFSASEVANYIINNSTYNINFLPYDKIDKAAENLKYIKKGFSLIYNISVKYKYDLMALLKTLIPNDIKLNLIAGKIQNLSFNDMKSQLFFIDKRFSKNNDYKLSIKFSKDKTNKNIEKEKLLSIVCKIGDYIIEKSIIGFKDSTLERTWIDECKKGIIKSMDNSLFCGNSGVALFLAYLGEVTDKNYFIFASHEALYPVLRAIEQEGLDTFSYLDILAVFYTILKIYNVTHDIRLNCFITNNCYMLLQFLRKNTIYYDIYNINITKEIDSFDIENSVPLEKLLGQILFLEITLYNKYENKLYIYLSSMLYSKLILKSDYNDNFIIDKKIDELVKYIVSKDICSNLYKICRDLNLINYAAKTINDSSLKNMSINTLTLIIKEILDNYKSKKINLFDQQISFKNGLAGLGYNLLNFITLSEL